MNVPVWVAIEEGRCAHGQIFQSGCELDAFVGSSLIDMYAKCGSMEDAWRAFNKIPSGNLISCTAMIFEHIELWQKALELF
jgi:pentatricopeptide repeat protein